MASLVISVLTSPFARICLGSCYLQCGTASGCMYMVGVWSTGRRCLRCFASCAHKTELGGIPYRYLCTPPLPSPSSPNAVHLLCNPLHCFVWLVCECPVRQQRRRC
ncbi:hypothetical protein B0H11DRAFT_1959270, partial [Mycena galericulata]